MAGKRITPLGIGHPGEGDVSEKSEEGECLRDEVSEEGECPRDEVSDLIDSVDCIELEVVGYWRQGPVRSKVVNIQEVKDVQGLLVLPCYDIETEEGHEGTTTVLGLADNEAENEAGGQREGICDACLGSVIIGETCVCSVDLFDGPRGREQDTGGLAARESRENVDCLYHIMTENEGGYLYLEAGTPVSKEGSEVSGAEEVWDRLGIGVIEPTTDSERRQTWTDGQPTTSERPTKLRTSDEDQSWTDGQPPTSERPKEQLTDSAQAWMDEPLPPPDEDQSRTPPNEDQSRTAGPLRASDQHRAWNSAQEFEVMALEPGTPESDEEFQAVFKNTLGFPMARRPIDSLRRMETQTPDETIHDSFVGCQVSIGSRLSEQHRKQAERLVWNWRDRFCNSIVDLPATDLIAHRIPTIRCKPVRINNALFTQKEVEWQRKHLPDMLSTGIID